VTDKSWLLRAKCREPELSPLFSKVFDTDAKANTANIARRVCLDCPVNVECYKLAVANKEKWGVWGGVNFGRHTSIITQRTNFDMEVRRRKTKRKYVKSGKYVKVKS